MTTETPGEHGSPHPGAPPPARPVILFDGVCNLCNSYVAWVIRHDRSERFAFASLRSRAAARALEGAGVGLAGKDGGLQSIVLIDSGGVHTKSAAAIRIARGIGFPWSLAVVGLALPRGVRDGVYGWVARNRYRWFGKTSACMTPTPELRARFLDAEE